MAPWGPLLQRRLPRERLLSSPENAAGGVPATTLMIGEEPSGVIYVPGVLGPADSDSGIGFSYRGFYRREREQGTSVLFLDSDVLWL